MFLLLPIKQFFHFTITYFIKIFIYDFIHLLIHLIPFQLKSIFNFIRFIHFLIVNFRFTILIFLY